eukprot:1196187-Prorocentrum_minimum.AAC.9
MAEAEAAAHAAAAAAHRCVAPRGLFRALQGAVAADAVVTAEGYGGALEAAEHMRCVLPRMLLPPARHLSATPAGFALAAGVGAKLARPQRQVVAITSERALTASGGLLAAAARAGSALVALVEVEAEPAARLSALAAAAVGAGSPVVDCDVARLAAACQVERRVASSEAEVRASLAWALARSAEARRPCVVEVRVSHAAPPLYWRSTVLGLAPAPSLLAPAGKPPRPTNGGPGGAAEERLVPVARKGDTSFAESLYQARESGLAAYDVWDCLAHAREHYGARVACVENAKSCTYEQLGVRAAKLGGHLLHEGGLKRGDRVGVMLANKTQVMEAHYAVVGAARGAVLNLNQRLSPPELAYILSDATPRWLIVGCEFRALIEKAVEATEATIEGVLWVSEESEEEAVRARLPPACRQEAYTPVTEGYKCAVGTPAPANGGDACEMYYTSGSTGRPKGVMLTHKMVVKHALGCMLMHRITGADVWGHIAPMFHLVDAYAMFAITWVGGKHVLLPAFSAGVVLSAIEQQRITVTNMASTMATLLLSDPSAEQRDFSSLSMLSCGGAPLNARTVERAMRLFDCEFFCSYGMTECCGKISMSLLGEAERALPQAEQLALVCTSGKPFVFTEVRVVREDFTDVRLDGEEVGECVIRGDTVFTGYWESAAATAEAFRDGWFLTGDLGVMNKYGYVTLTDRKKDMILTGSENVYSAEVEKVLLDHVAVLQACVYGIPNEALGELVKAMVVLKPGKELTQRQLQKHCQLALGDYKVPRLIEFADKLPMLGSGKVAKAEIKKRERERYTPKEKRVPAAPAAPAPATAPAAAPAAKGPSGGGVDERMHQSTYR